MNFADEKTELLIKHSSLGSIVINPGAINVKECAEIKWVLQTKPLEDQKDKDRMIDYLLLTEAKLYCHPKDRAYLLKEGFSSNRVYVLENQKIIHSSSGSFEIFLEKNKERSFLQKCISQVSNLFRLQQSFRVNVCFDIKKSERFFYLEDRNLTQKQFRLLQKKNTKVIVNETEKTQEWMSFARQWGLEILFTPLILPISLREETPCLEKQKPFTRTPSYEESYS